MLINVMLIKKHVPVPIVTYALYLKNVKNYVNTLCALDFFGR